MQHLLQKQISIICKPTITIPYYERREAPLIWKVYTSFIQIRILTKLFATTINSVLLILEGSDSILQGPVLGFVSMGSLLLWEVDCLWFFCRCFISKLGNIINADYVSRLVMKCLQENNWAQTATRTLQFNFFAIFIISDSRSYSKTNFLWNPDSSFPFLSLLFDPWLGVLGIHSLLPQGWWNMTIINFWSA